MNFMMQTYVIYNEQGELKNIISYNIAMPEEKIQKAYINIVNITDHPKRQEIIADPSNFIYQDGKIVKRE